MTMTKVFPTILIVLDVLAAIAYAYHGWPVFPEWRKVLYWGSAAVLTYTVTF